MSTWTRSNRCDTGTCVEVHAHLLSCDAGTCVEVADLDTPVVRVRDSKDPGGLVLTIEMDDWRTFLAGVKDGDFDL